MEAKAWTFKTNAKAIDQGHTKAMTALCQDQGKHADRNPEFRCRATATSDVLFKKRGGYTQVGRLLGDGYTHAHFIWMDPSIGGYTRL